jgi:hypothetical protein
VKKFITQRRRERRGDKWVRFGKFVFWTGLTGGPQKILSILPKNFLFLALDFPFPWALGLPETMNLKPKNGS